ncbi:hypothetical protein cyc_00466 [Cyclospora cayetanensis]|uniref:UDP-N-acetylglucosamine transferase subunit ALG14 n=1 Tax=Cyclospora cayetanensis TaxID=88456 RepID=A0A1D3CUV5_9EIME|nr:hypothetical protein cyc_00466 [Cyclospora cayetanensis]
MLSMVSWVSGQLLRLGKKVEAGGSERGPFIDSVANISIQGLSFACRPPPPHLAVCLLPLHHDSPCAFKCGIGTQKTRNIDSRSNVHGSTAINNIVAVCISPFQLLFQVRATSVGVHSAPGPGEAAAVSAGSAAEISEETGLLLRLISTVLFNSKQLVIFSLLLRWLHWSTRRVFWLRILELALSFRRQRHAKHAGCDRIGSEPHVGQREPAARVPERRYQDAEVFFGRDAPPRNTSSAVHRGLFTRPAALPHELPPSAAAADAAGETKEGKSAEEGQGCAEKGDEEASRKEKEQTHEVVNTIKLGPETSEDSTKRAAARPSKSAAAEMSSQRDKRYEALHETWDVKTLIVLGSGGHTTEMLRLVEELDPRIFQFTFVIADTDTCSLSQGISQPDPFSFSFIPRCREVGDSLFRVPLRFARAFMAALRIVIKEKPKLVGTDSSMLLFMIRGALKWSGNLSTSGSSCAAVRGEEPP